MIFRAWAIRSGPRSPEVRTTRQTVNVGMTSSLFGSGWRKYSLRPLSHLGRYGPVKDKNPARPNHADFMACDYNIDHVIKGGKTKAGQQRYKCQNADCPCYSFQLNLLYKGRVPAIKEQIVDMSLNGSGIRDTARVLKISPTTVINELKKKSLRSP